MTAVPEKSRCAVSKQGDQLRSLLQVAAFAIALLFGCGLSSDEVSALASPFMQEAATQESAKPEKPDEQETEQEEVDSRENPLHLSTWGLKDAHRFPNGRIVFLRDYYGPSKYNVAEEDLETLSYYSTSHYKYYSRIFHLEEDPKAVYAIEARNDTGAAGHSIYRHQLNDEGSELVAKFREKVTSPQYLITDKGTAYIYGRNGVIYRWSKKDGLTRYEIPVPEDYREHQAKRRSRWRPLHALKLPNNQVAFYSHVDPRYPKCELRDLLVFDGPKPRRIDLKGQATGPALFVNKTIATDNNAAIPNGILFVCNDRFLTVDLDLGKVIESSGGPFIRPVSEGTALIATHVFGSVDGPLTVLWRKPMKSKRDRVPPGFADGYLNRFATFDGKQWTLLSRGKDFQFDQHNTMDVDSKGNTWISMGHGGVMRIGNDGQFADFGFDRGMGFTAPNFIKVNRKDDFLMWASGGGEPTLAFVDTKKLKKSDTKTVGKWSTVVSRIPLEWDKRERFMLFSTSPSKGLIDYQQGKQVSIPLPEGLDATMSISVTRDSNHDIWIMQDGVPEATWYRKDEKWERFDPIIKTVMAKDPNSESGELRPVEKMVLPSKEVAFQAMLERGADESYVIGRRFNDYRVAFGPNRQIAFRNEGDRVSYFDGKRWATSREGLELEDEYLEQQVFFHEGKTTIYGDDDYSWNLESEQWKENWDTDDFRPWNRISAVKYPFEGEQYYNVSSSHPEGGPFNEDETDWGYRASTIDIASTFIRAHDELAVHHPSGCWNIMKSAGTPLDQDSSFSSIWVDCDNRWFFAYPEVNGLHRYVVYEPETVDFQVEQPDLGVVDRPNAKLSPKWSTSPKLEKVKYRFRVDASEWSDWLDPKVPIRPPGFSEKGIHSLELQLHSEPMPLRHHVLKYRFEVTYELERFLLPLYQQIQSDDYEVRQAGVDGIIACGPSAIPFLKKQMETDSAELKMTLEMLVQLLESKSGDEPDQ